jgi:hypothetical protein
MLSNFQHFFMNRNKNATANINDNYKKLFEFQKMKPIYIPPYQYIPIYNTCVYRLDSAKFSEEQFTKPPIISQKLYNAIKYSSIFTNEEYKKPVPVKMKMYI